MSESGPESEGANSPEFKQSDIAKAWGCSEAYVSKLKGQGMPVGSLEAANKWRSERSAGRGIGFRSKSAPNEAGGPSESQNGQDAPKLTGCSNRFRHAAARAAKPKSLRSAESSVKAAIEIEELARLQVAEATAANQDSRLPNLIGAYTKAQSNRFAAEERLLALQEKAGTLIPATEAKGTVAKILGTLFSRLRAVPAKSGPRANPSDDLLAESVIRGDIDAAIAETHTIAKNLLGLSSDEIAAAATS